MKILFSNPPWWVGKDNFFGRWTSGVRCGSRWPFTQKVWSRPNIHIYGDYTPYPFFLGYACSYTESKFPNSTIFRDSIAIKESYENFFAFLQSNKFDFIVLECATPSWEHDEKLIKKILKISPNTKIILAGPITINESLKILNNNQNIIACIKGEYEKGVVRVLNGENGIIEHDLMTTEEMNAAPYPYYDNLIARKYLDFNPRGQKFPHAHVWSSRGCPFKCIFCVWPATMTGNDPDGSGVRKVRYYSEQYMEGFLKDLVNKYKFRSIYFDDDTFNLGKGHVEKMCRVMDRIKLPWSAMCRPDTLNKETWKMMKESGCFAVKLGFESGNQYVNTHIVNKHLNLEEGASTVRYLKSIGMNVHGTFTYGLPGETKEQMLDTKKFIKSLPFDSIQESGTAEIEGTPLHELRRRGKLEKYDGAQIDDAYTISNDGNQKWIKLINTLKNN